MRHRWLTDGGPADISLAYRRGEGLTENTQIRRKRLRFRSWHRGTREMDLLLGSFAEACVENFSELQLERYEALLEISDPDLFAWISGREAVPAAHDNDVMKLMRNFKFQAKTD